MTREFIDGDRVGYEASAAINQYDFVTLTGERTVAPTATDGGELWGIAMNSAEVGETITIVQHGLYEANVADAAVANDDLTGSATSGQARAVDPAATSPAYQDWTVRAIEDLPEANRMLVYKS